MSVIVDGSTDSSVTEQELVYVHSCSGGIIANNFVALVPVEVADAPGKNKGMAALLKRKQPHLQAIHCSAHKLELAFNDCLKKSSWRRSHNCCFSSTCSTNRAQENAAFFAEHVMS